jgi:hypothetical protein
VSLRKRVAVECPDSLAAHLVPGLLAAGDRCFDVLARQRFRATAFCISRTQGVVAGLLKELKSPEF